ncbi:hypothetical protein, partial [uncultured Campylobacter sp.]|uniref:hypothetical protein n=1 Tax=uncultured Campylobacter sp. TaxID=218934 RepID=UPI0026024382
TKRRPFLSQALSNPTAREKLLHCVQVKFGAIAPHVFKFAFLWCGSRRVKFANLKFDYKKSRRSIAR